MSTNRVGHWSSCAWDGREETARDCNCGAREKREAALDAMTATGTSRRDQAEALLVAWFHGSTFAPYAATGHSTDKDNCWMCAEAADALLPLVHDAEQEVRALTAAAANLRKSVVGTYSTEEFARWLEQRAALVDTTMTVAGDGSLAGRVLALADEWMCDPGSIPSPYHVKHCPNCNRAARLRGLVDEQETETPNPCDEA